MDLNLYFSPQLYRLEVFDTKCGSFKIHLGIHLWQLHQKHKQKDHISFGRHGAIFCVRSLDIIVTEHTKKRKLPEILFLHTLMIIVQRKGFNDVIWS